MIIMTKLDIIKQLIAELRDIYVPHIKILKHSNNSVTLLFREAYEQDKVLSLSKQQTIDLLEDLLRQSYYAALYYTI